MSYGSDGHTGVSNNQVNGGSNRNFRFVLSLLAQASGDSDFVIHASHSSFYTGGFQPWDFLRYSGFTKYDRRCPFFHDECHYTVLAKVDPDDRGMLDRGQIGFVHERFNRLVASSDALFQAASNYFTQASRLGLNPELADLVGEPVKIELDPAAIPPWVDDVKFPALKQAEKDRDKACETVTDLSEYLVLLFGEGEQLEQAVRKGLEALGLRARLAERGATVDVLAESQDGSKRFGVEVTGTPEGIKKKSNKLTQVVDFERIKENNEKTILLANTFKVISIPERDGKEHFTQPAVDFLKSFPVLLMTGWDLYRMVGDVREGKREPEELVEILYRTSGVLTYP